MKTKQYERHYFQKNWQGTYASQAINPTYKKKVEEIMALGFKKGKVLDIGCAYGFLLKIFEEKGFKAFGLDISSFALKKAKKICQAKLFKVDIAKEKIPVKNDFFDVITSIFSLEHVENYSFMLRECFRVLKKRGLFYVLIPANKRWFGDNYHINYFTLKSLVYVLSKNHFSIIKIGEEGGKFQLPSGLVRLIVKGNTNFNFVPQGTGCFISCFAKK